MIPRITLGLIIVVIVAYVLGARYPGLAAKVGLA
jgi:hypothetical protein